MYSYPQFRTESNQCQALTVTAQSNTVGRMVTNDSREVRLAFSRRLNEALDDMGLPPKHQGRQTQAATLFKITQKGVRKWLEGEAIPSTDRWPDVAAKAKVNINWLFFGQGAKRGSEHGLSPAAIKIASAWQNAPADVQIALSDALRVPLTVAELPATKVGTRLDAGAKKAMTRLDDEKPKKLQLKHR